MPSKGYRTSHYRKTHIRKTKSGVARIGSTTVHGCPVKRKK